MSFIRTGSLALSFVATVAGALAAGEPTGTDGNAATQLTWRRSYKQAAEEARLRRRPILVAITATWCAPCRQMHQVTFTDERVRRRLRRDFVLLALDADQHPELVAGFKVQSYPTTLVVSPELKIVNRVAGFQSANDLVTVLESTRMKVTDDKPTVIDDSDAVSALDALVARQSAVDRMERISRLDDRQRRAHGG